MKKTLGVVLLAIGVAGIVLVTQIQYWEPGCCVCNDGWTVGSGVIQEIKRSQEKYQGAPICGSCELLGCALSRRIIPIDYLTLSLAFGSAGVYVLIHRKIYSSTAFNNEDQPREK